MFRWGDGVLEAPARASLPFRNLCALGFEPCGITEQGQHPSDASGHWRPLEAKGCITGPLALEARAGFLPGACGEGLVLFSQNPSGEAQSCKLQRGKGGRIGVGGGWKSVCVCVCVSWVSGGGSSCTVPPPFPAPPCPSHSPFPSPPLLSPCIDPSALPTAPHHLHQNPIFPSGPFTPLSNLIN